MKILCLSDLHLMNFRMMDQEIQRLLGLWNSVGCFGIDVIVISGDVFEYNIKFSAYKRLIEIFGEDTPIIFTLGNHDFFFRTIEETLEKYTNDYNPAKYNVHCLDVIGRYEIGNVRFVGNVLWYDGSLRHRPNQDLYKWGNGGWMDKNIRMFDYQKEHELCVQQIKTNLVDDEKINVLVTHTVPFRALNGHDDDSPLNAFSGIDNFNKYLPLDGPRIKYAICGHTHKRVLGTFHGVNCVNTGSDYYPNDLEHYVLGI